MKSNNLGLSQAWLIILVVVVTAFIASSAAYWFQGYRNASEIEILKAQIAGFENQLAQVETDKDNLLMELNQPDATATATKYPDFDRPEFTLEYPLGWHIYGEAGLRDESPEISHYSFSPQPIFVFPGEVIFPINLTVRPDEGKSLAEWTSDVKGESISVAGTDAVKNVSEGLGGTYTTFDFVSEGNFYSFTFIDTTDGTGESEDVFLHMLATFTPK